MNGGNRIEFGLVDCYERKRAGILFLAVGSWGE